MNKKKIEININGLNELSRATENMSEMSKAISKVISMLKDSNDNTKERLTLEERVVKNLDKENRVLTEKLKHEKELIANARKRKEISSLISKELKENITEEKAQEIIQAKKLKKLEQMKKNIKDLVDYNIELKTVQAQIAAETKKQLIANGVIADKSKNALKNKKKEITYEEKLDAQLRKRKAKLDWEKKNEEKIIKLKKEELAIAKKRNNIISPPKETPSNSLLSGIAGKAASRIGFVLTAKASYEAIDLVQKGISETIKRLVDLEQGLKNVGTLLSEQEKSILPEYEQAIKSLTRTWNKDIGDVSDALYQIVSASVEAKDALMVLREAVVLGQVGRGTTEQAANVITTMMNAYGESAGKARDLAIQAQLIVQEGKTTIDKLNMSIGRLLSTTTSLGLNAKKSMAELSVLTRILPTREAITALSRAYDTLREDTFLLNKVREEGLIAIIPLYKEMNAEEKLAFAGSKRAIKAFDLLANNTDNTTMAYKELTAQISLLEKATESLTTTDKLKNFGKGLSDIIISSGKALLVVGKHLSKLLVLHIATIDYFTGRSKQFASTEKSKKELIKELEILKDIENYRFKIKNFTEEELEIEEKKVIEESKNSSLKNEYFALMKGLIEEKRKILKYDQEEISNAEKSLELLKAEDSLISTKESRILVISKLTEKIKNTEEEIAKQELGGKGIWEKKRLELIALKKELEGYEKKNDGGKSENDTLVDVLGLNIAKSELEKVRGDEKAYSDLINERMGIYNKLIAGTKDEKKKIEYKTALQDLMNDVYAVTVNATQNASPLDLNIAKSELEKVRGDEKAYNDLINERMGIYNKLIAGTKDEKKKIEYKTALQKLMNDVYAITVNATQNASPLDLNIAKFGLADAQDDTTGKLDILGERRLIYLDAINNATNEKEKIELETALQNTENEIAEIFEEFENKTKEEKGSWLKTLGIPDLSTQQAQMDFAVQQATKLYDNLYALKLQHIENQKQADLDALADNYEMQEAAINDAVLTEQQKNNTMSELNKKNKEEQAKIEEEANKKAAKEKKKQAIFDAFLDFAKGNMAIWGKWAANLPVALLLEGILLAALGTNLKLIDGQKFASGGVFNEDSTSGGSFRGGVAKGSSHAQGGIKAFSKLGQYFGEFEGDEPVLISNVSKNPELLAKASEINVAAGGVPLVPFSSKKFYADGGLFNAPTYKNNASQQMMAQAINVNVNNDGGAGVILNGESDIGLYRVIRNSSRNNGSF